MYLVPLAEHFWEIGSKVLLSIFCGTKITLEWISPPLPHFYIYPHPPHFEISLPPFVIGGAGGSGAGSNYDACDHYLDVGTKFIKCNYLRKVWEKEMNLMVHLNGNLEMPVYEYQWLLESL